MTKLIFAGIAFIAAISASAATGGQRDLLIKFSAGSLSNMEFLSGLQSQGAKVERLSDNWARVQGSSQKLSDDAIASLRADPAVEYVQPNYKIHLLESYKIEDALRRAALAETAAALMPSAPPVADNPAFQSVTNQGSGKDPLFAKQWGMNDIGVEKAWKITMGDPKIIVAVIDTGVDYNHEDLIANMWHNPGETGTDAQGHDKSSNAIDDDNNGYVDDVVGWDFAGNDNKPYDLYTDPMQLLMGGGNPGHGTHCAGNVAARGGNGVGISGVAPKVSVMAVRFISEKGEGTTADAVKAVKYAVDNGAKVLSNSWGSEGEDPAEGAANQALRDAVQYAQDKGVLFIAAAGNGHNGAGYDNDSDAAPSFPATYPHDNIISVAAIDADNKLASFSNWGVKTVDIAAPGVKVFSTVPDKNKYNDYVINVGGFEATWDGTSMACPHVAGAAALYWSAHPSATWKDVKNAILSSATKIPALDGKVVSGGKLNVDALLRRR